jgi:hypothetical protein
MTIRQPPSRDFYAPGDNVGPKGFGGGGAPSAPPQISVTLNASVVRQPPSFQLIAAGPVIGFSGIGGPDGDAILDEGGSPFLLENNTPLLEE